MFLQKHEMLTQKNSKKNCCFLDCSVSVTCTKLKAETGKTHRHTSNTSTQSSQEDKVEVPVCVRHASRVLVFTLIGLLKESMANFFTTCVYDRSVEVFESTTDKNVCCWSQLFSAFLRRRFCRFFLRQVVLKSKQFALRLRVGAPGTQLQKQFLPSQFL